MKEKRNIQTVQKSIAAFSRENRRMPSFAEMVGLLGVRPKTELKIGGVVTAVIRKYHQ